MATNSPPGRHSLEPTVSTDTALGGGRSRRQVLLATGTLAVAGLAGCLAGQDPEGQASNPTSTGGQAGPLGLADLRRVAEADGVSFAVDFVNPLVAAGGDHPLRAEAAEHLVFAVAMTTHSGDLTSVDWGKRARLQTSDGHDIDGLEWVWQRESDHHPVGYFLGGRVHDGRSVLTDATEWLELSIRGAEGATSTFTWELGQLGTGSGHAVAPLRAYIANAYSGTISVIDHESQSVVETVAVADRTSHGLAAHPNGEFLYTGDGKDGNIYVISTESFEVVETIDVESSAHGIDIHPSGRHLYVSGGSVNTRGDVVVVDLESYEIVERIATDGAGHINFGPGGRYAYVSNVDLDRIAVIDTEAMELLATVSVGAGPNEAVASPDGAFVYTANVWDDSVSVVATDGWEEVDRIPAGEGTHGIAVSPDGTFVWTSNRASNDVTVIDAETREVVETIPAWESVNHLAISPDGSTVYVTATESGSVLLVDSRTFEPLGRVEVGEEPHEIAFTGSG